VNAGCSAGRGWLTWALTVLLLAGPWSADVDAGGGPENVVVVVNRESQASLAIANEFVRLRHIPPSNVVYVAKPPSVERVTVDVFRQMILLPVLKAIDERKLIGQIDYVVYSADLPYTIDARRDLRKAKPPRIFTPIAAITGLTYLYRFVVDRNPAYLSMNANRYMRRPLIAKGSAPLTRDEAQSYRDAMKRIEQTKWDEASALIADLVKQHPKNNHMLYNLACCHARQGKPDEALDTLRRAVEAGWMNHRHAQADKDFESIRSRKEFKQLIEGMKNITFGVQPTRGFRNSYEWDAKGNAVPTGGQRYMLSTMLAVTSGRGNTVAEALACLRRAASADGTRPKGTIYFMQNGNVRSTTRDWAFKSAAAMLAKLGVKAEIAQGVLPKGKPDVQGAVIGTAGFRWKACGSTILPGAICEHLTSFGGVLRKKAGQTPLTEFIRHGAAGASGTVTEPLAIAAKFPSPFIQVHYARGCTLAEAFYQSVHGPYQLLIVGDPLCRPWARIPQVAVEGVKAGDTVKGQLALRPTVTDRKPSAIHHFELFLDGLHVATCAPGKQLKLDTTQHADGAHELRVVAVAADAAPRAAPIETQGRLILPVTVSNHGRKLVLIAPKQRTIPADQPLTLTARLNGASEITVFHNARRVGVVPGEQGKMEIDPKRLGLGRVVLYAIGTLTEPATALVRSQPLVLDVQAAAK